MAMPYQLVGLQSVAFIAERVSGSGQGKFPVGKGGVTLISYGSFRGCWPLVWRLPHLMKRVLRDFRRPD